MPDLAFSRDGIRLLGILFRWYGLALIAATWGGAVITAGLARRTGRDPEHVWRALVWIIPAGLIGARLWFVLFPPQSVVALGRDAGWMLGHFFELNQGAIAVWSGGLGIIGGVTGGLLSLWRYARVHREPLLPWLDLAVVGLAFAQIIGRWGNGANGELYGPVTDLPWGVLIDNAVARVGQFIDLGRYPLATTRFHPVWLYESILCGIIFGVLLTLMLRRRLPRPGTLVLVYLLLYGTGRYALEFLRVNVSLVAGLNLSQMIMAGCAAIAGALLWQRWWSNRASNPPEHNTIP